MTKKHNRLYNNMSVDKDKQNTISDLEIRFGFNAITVFDKQNKVRLYKSFDVCDRDIIIKDYTSRFETSRDITLDELLNDGFCYV